MSIEDKGWIGGKGSMADALWDRMWSGGPASSSGDITHGPMAQFQDDYDPAITQRELNAKSQKEMREKTARVLGNDNNFESPSEPGGNRMSQSDTGAGRDSAVQQGVADAKSQTGGQTKKDSSPSTGATGANIMRRMRAKGNAETTVETTTKSVGEADGESLGKGHNLVIKEPAPTPKEMRPGNLSDYQQKSSWTGSGPQAALHNDYSKVGSALLDIAGVPFHDLPESSLIMQKIAHASYIIKEASDENYLARDDVHPLKLLAELTDTLGEDWSDWEPETIRETIIKEAGVEASDDVMSKIMAVKIVLARPDRFFDDWHAFEKISVALNDSSPTMSSIEEIPVEWLSNAVSIVEKIATKGDFSPEVKKYVAARLWDQGYVVPPPKLAFAESDLSPMVDNPSLQKKVVLAYSKAMKSSDLPHEEDPVSIQVSRLIRNHVYVLDKIEESRAQLS